MNNLKKKKSTKHMLFENHNPFITVLNSCMSSQLYEYPSENSALFYIFTSDTLQ